MSDETQAVKFAKRVHNVLVDAHVEADVSGLTWGLYNAPPDVKARRLEQAVKEFHDFIRDHRSMDSIQLQVVRVVRDQCSECGEEWETQVENGVTECAYCGVEVAP